MAIILRSTIPICNPPLQNREMLPRVQAENAGLDNRPDLFHKRGIMAKGDNLSEFEQITLTAVMLERKNAYGMTIHERMESLVKKNRIVSLGAVYTTLDRLEQKGYVKSWFGGATEERGGRSKRYFEITGSGERALKKSLAVAGNMLRELGYA